jgi:hypothetical protein
LFAAIVIVVRSRVRGFTECDDCANKHQHKRDLDHDDSPHCEAETLQLTRSPNAGVISDDFGLRSKFFAAASGNNF